MAGKDKKQPVAEKEKKAPRVGPIKFIRQVRAEADLISWTTLKETQQATIFVLIMATIFSLFLLSADTIIQMILRLTGLIQSGTGT
jgi:preprotein translocase subunit SecE